jgi:hypothetical protein
MLVNKDLKKYILTYIPASPANEIIMYIYSM